MIIDKPIAQARSKYLQKIRDFFINQNFTEVETPIMTPIPGMEPHLTPFETNFKTSREQQKLYLNTSPEIQMKKLLGAGYGNIFNITKVFRNGESGGAMHNPEFTMLEWYRTNSDYKAIMNDCEQLITSLAGSSITYKNNVIDLSSAWSRKSVNELFIEYCDINLLKNRDQSTFKKTALQQGFEINDCEDWDDIFFKIFLNHIEPHLGLDKPVFVYDYPSTQAALAKKSETEPFFAERFELYIAGIELANAFSELIDPKEQRIRLQEEQDLRRKLGKTVFDIDEEFLTSLESIQHPCAGIALGIDRLMMLLMNKTSIKDVILFPIN